MENQNKTYSDLIEIDGVVYATSPACSGAYFTYISLLVAWSVGFGLIGLVLINI